MKGKTKKKASSILVINDSKELLAFLTNIIVDQGYNANVLNSPHNALEKILFKKPDIVMVDINMPGMSGIELTTLLRKTKETKNIYIIICSATFFDRRAVEEAITAGANDFITLPSDPVSIMTHINMALVNLGLSKDNKKMSDRLKDQEKLIDDLLKNTPDIIYFKNRDGNLILVNHAHAEGHGKQPEELVGKRDFDLFPYEEAVKMTIDDLYVMETRKPVVDKIEYTTRPTGEKLYVSTTKVPRLDHKNKVIGIMGITRNITPRVMAEQKLHEEKRLTDQIINSLGIPAFVIDKNHRILFWNDACEKITGIRERELIGTDQHWKVFYNEKRPCLADLLVDGLTEKLKDHYESDAKITVEDDGCTLETWYTDRTGRKRYIIGSANVIKAESGEVIAAIETFQDITVHQKLEDELKKKEALLSELVLRDPLTDLYNYRYLKERLDSELSRAHRYASFLSLVMVDIDYFKSLNDAYGHEQGNTILKSIATFFREFCRDSDIVARVGGDEFLFLLPDTHLSGLEDFSKRLQKGIQKHVIHIKNQRIKVNISVGAACYPDIFIQSSSDFLEIIDEALKLAKERGGDKIEICTRENFLQINGVEHHMSLKELKTKIHSLEKRVEHTVVEFLLSFAKSLEGEPYYPPKQIENMMDLVEKMGRKLKLRKEAVEDLKCASAVCNIGKACIDPDVFKKKGKLSKQEFEKIKQHPRLSAEIIRDVESLKGAFPAVLYHHERFDGSGYVYGLKGKQIPLCARILAVAEAYQSLVSDKPYRPAYTPDKACGILEQCAGEKFDPEVVEVLKQVYRN